MGPWRVDLGTEGEPASLTLRAGDELTLGSGRAATLRVEDRAVSSLHCRLRVLESGIFVEDLSS
jgi:pSer/pThr/pTyr-binding forkhead associated (FHA) protein